MDPRDPPDHPHATPLTRVENSAFAGGEALEGRTLGPWVIEAPLGEGGMGSVWRARRSDGTYQGLVAIKLVRPGLDSKTVLARFEAERQVLARMNHPNIARVFDAGTSPDGRPWFAMEHVEGPPLTAYCEANRLTVRERLDLFLDVCAAARHAHQHGIIHRDLKPSNILVAVVDGKPVPKVIDFGIAKATGDPAGASPLVTRLGERVGTPAYMSPEQWEGAAQGVDTRADIYALGVLLFEVLVGVLPRDPLITTPQGSVPLGRPIGEDAPRPTVRFAGLGDERERIAAARRTDSAGLKRLLRGDLNWIVLKAIEREPDRRYETVAAFAEDIRNHLSDQPVQAGPPSVRYRAGKFVRRHRWGVAGAAAALAVLVAGVAIAGVGLARAIQSERLAARERDKATAINEFLLETFSSADPFAGAGRDTTIVQALDAAVKKVDTAFAGRPETHAAILQVIGATYAQLGRNRDAEPLLRRAVELRRGLGPEAEADLAQSLNDLAVTMRDGGAVDAKQALLDEALAIRRKLAPGDSPATAETLSNMAYVANSAGERDRAIALYRDTIAMRERLFGAEEERTLSTRASLAQALRQAGDLEGSGSVLQEIVDVQRRTLAKGDPHRALALANLSRVRSEQGKLEDAESLTREALAIRREALGPDHPDTVETLGTLALVVRREGRHEEAIKLFREAIETVDRTHGSPVTRGQLIASLAGALKDTGDFAGSARAYEEAAAIFRAEQGPEHPNVATALFNLGQLKVKANDPRGAEGYQRQALAIRLKAFGPDSVDVAVTREGLAGSLGRQKKFDEALALYDEALAVFDAKLPAGDERTARCRKSREELLKAKGTRTSVRPR